jgi:hypothetical protein
MFLPFAFLTTRRWQHCLQLSFFGFFVFGPDRPRGLREEHLLPVGIQASALAFFFLLLFLFLADAASPRPAAASTKAPSPPPANAVTETLRLVGPFRRMCLDPCRPPESS